jgi:hypothetical protein
MSKLARRLVAAEQSASVTWPALQMNLCVNVASMQQLCDSLYWLSLATRIHPGRP